MAMEDGGYRIQPLGGAPGCVAMIVFSIAASIVLTILLNVALRLL